MSTTTTATGAHILVFPYPAPGHILPLLDLTHQLVIRGLTITIIITPKNLHYLTTLLSTHPTSIQTLVLPFPKHPSIPHGVENVKDLPIGAFRDIMRAMGELYSPILNWFESHPSPPIAILSDLFLGWTHQLASQLGIKRFVFTPSGALAASIVNCLWRDLPKRNDPNDENALISFPDIPGCPTYPWFKLSMVFRSFVEGDPDSEFIKNGMLSNIKSSGIVLNTFNELESVYLDHLKKDLEHERVFAVGPLLQPSDEHKERGGSNSLEVNHLLSWLDTCPNRSVVYVCFGSEAVLNNKQMEELAIGLEKSGIKFVWIVKEATLRHVVGEYGVVPTGFEDRVAGRGFVIKGWVPQIVILNHRAVGSFLTHCGGNSIVEGLTAGVLMLAWPFGADHHISANLLVDNIGVAVKVCEGAMTIPNADRLARILTESVNDNWSMGEKARELSQVAQNAAKEGGSSYRDLDRLVKELSALGHRK